MRPDLSLNPEASPVAVCAVARGRAASFVRRQDGDAVDANA